MPARPVKGKAAISSEFTIRKASEADLDILVDQRIGMYRDMLAYIKPDFRGYRRRYSAWARTMTKRKKLVSFLVIDRLGKPAAGGI